MSLSEETKIPAAPRGLRKPLKIEWARMAEIMLDQGISPSSRLDLMHAYLRIAIEESELDLEWEDATLAQKLALGRRFSALMTAKLRVRKLLLAAP